MLSSIWLYIPDYKANRALGDLDTSKQSTFQSHVFVKEHLSSGDGDVELVTPDGRSSWTSASLTRCNHRSWTWARGAAGCFCAWVLCVEVKEKTLIGFSVINRNRCSRKTLMAWQSLKKPWSAYAWINLRKTSALNCTQCALVVYWSIYFLNTCRQNMK